MSAIKKLMARFKQLTARDMIRPNYYNRRASCWLPGLLAVCLLVCFWMRPVAAQTNDDLEALVNELNKRIEALESDKKENDIYTRVESLEDSFFELDERVGAAGIVHAFDALNIDLGGFLTQSFTTAVGEDENESSFNQTQFEILLGIQATEDWSMFAALGFLREADLDLSNPEEPNFRNSAVRIPPIIVWANYERSDKLNIRMGRYITPHGIINIEHFAPNLLDQNQPQFLRPFSGATIFPNFLDGVNIHGRFFFGRNQMVKYDVYAGQFVAGDSDDLITGGRLAYTAGDSGFTFGANYSHGKRRARGAAPALGNMSVVPTTSLTTNDYNTVGGDLLYDKGRILWKNEYFISFEDEVENRIGFYTQPAFRFTDKWIGYYRFDYLDPGQGLPVSIENLVGINYLPNPIVRIRAEYFFKHFNDFTDNTGVATGVPGIFGGGPQSTEDTGIFQLSATVSF